MSFFTILTALTRLSIMLQPGLYTLVAVASELSGASCTATPSNVPSLWCQTEREIWAV